MGGQTLGMYIIHVTILTICDNNHWVIDAQDQLWGNILEVAGFIVLSTLTMLLVKLLSRWKWTRIFVLGQQ